MLSPFSCGTFHQEDDDDDEPMMITSTTQASSPPRNSKPRSTSRVYRSRSKDSNKNPYSSRGLDKFSALLAELEEKRQRIYAQTDSQDISFVRFVYRNTNDDVPVPIVVKLKDKKEDNKTKSSDIIEGVKEKQVTRNSEALDKFSTIDQSSVSPKDQVKQLARLKLDRLRRPSYYLPVFIVFILLFLAVFGRSAAILCTSIGWYALPTLKEIKNTRRASKKKHLVRRLGDNKMVSDGLSSPPKQNHTMAIPPLQQHGHGHKKSW